MAVRKRGNTWVIDYRANGKRYTRAVGPNKRDAIGAEGKIKAQIREGRFFLSANGSRRPRSGS